MEEWSVCVQAEIEIVVQVPEKGFLTFCADNKHHQDRIWDFSCCYLGFFRWSFQNGSSNRSCEAVWSIHGEVREKMRQMDQFSLTKSLHAEVCLPIFFNSAVLKGIWRGMTLQSIEGFILSNRSWTRPGTVPAAKEPRILITPIKPDTVSAWPTQDLAVPITRGFLGLQESDPVSEETITSTYSAFCCDILSWW